MMAAEKADHIARALRGIVAMHVIKERSAPRGRRVGRPAFAGADDLPQRIPAKDPLAAAFKRRGQRRGVGKKHNAPFRRQRERPFGHPLQLTAVQRRADRLTAGNESTVPDAVGQIEHIEEHRAQLRLGHVVIAVHSLFGLIVAYKPRFMMAHHYIVHFVRQHRVFLRAEHIAVVIAVDHHHRRLRIALQQIAQFAQLRKRLLLARARVVAQVVAA